MLKNQHPYSGLSASVGSCGTNKPEEVKAIQNLIKNAGYALATGRSVIIDGRCDTNTTEAIRWYQRLLNMSPSGLVQPTDTWFMHALQEATSHHFRPKHRGGSLSVRQGQLTFDAEGVDYITAVEPFRQRRYPNFSRILQWPPTASSGVTLGRGYDMGSRSMGEIFITLRQAGIEEYKAVICSKSAHVKGPEAGRFVKVYGPLVGEITHQQQIRLFELAYQVKLNEAKNLYRRVTRHFINAPQWELLDQKIRDVIVDIFYQGVHNAKSLFQAAIDGREALISHIKNSPTYATYEKHRNRIRYLQ